MTERPDHHWFMHVAAAREWVVRANVGALIVWIAVAGLAFGHLPDRIPVHFTAAGSPTRWESATWGWWLLLPLLALALMFFLPLMERVQQWLDRPFAGSGRDTGVDEIRLRLRRAYLDLCSLILTLVLALLHLGGWLVATGSAETLPVAILVGAGAGIAAILGLIVPLQRAEAAAG
jgi:uncharacterized membrane protein